MLFIVYFSLLESRESRDFCVLFTAVSSGPTAVLKYESCSKDYLLNKLRNCQFAAKCLQYLKLPNPFLGLSTLQVKASSQTLATLVTNSN